MLLSINTPLYYKFGSLGVMLVNNNQSLSELAFDEDGFAFKK